MHLRILVVPAIAGLALIACGGNGDGSNGSSAGASPNPGLCASGTITVSGSTALQPLVQRAADLYQAKCPGASVTVSGGGSAVGLNNVAAGTSDIGDSDVPVSNAKSVDPAAVADHLVAVVVFAVIANPAAGVTNLTAAQVRDVFSGRVTNWKQVGGRDEAVSLVERSPGSGTRLGFDKDIMGSTDEATKPAFIEDSTDLVLRDVAGAPGGVSYLAVGSAKGSVTSLSIDGVAPTGANVQGGTYKVFSHEHMYTRTAPSPLAGSFIRYVLSADFQTKQIPALGYLPLSTTSKEAVADQ